MRIVVTGGGTGGHIYPALEVARAAAACGADVVFMGSLRGPEGEICGREGIPFFGFPSQPIYSMRSPKGWSAALSGLNAMRLAKQTLRKMPVDVVFSTGGYGAAPVMGAARSLGIPYVIHEANSIPGRANRMFLKKASALTCVFRTTQSHFPQALRTGQPIRAALREAAQQSVEREGVIVTGGSQGSAYLNQVAPAAAQLAGDFAWLHATGPKNYESFKNMLLPTRYRAKPFLEADEMADGYATAKLAIGRSGGSLAEYALFRLPSVLIPLPTSADDHQLHNAKEFVAMEAATLLPQSSATPAALAAAVNDWMMDEKRRLRAHKALAEWDLPNATDTIVSLLYKAVEQA